MINPKLGISKLGCLTFQTLSVKKYSVQIRDYENSMVTLELYSMLIMLPCMVWYIMGICVLCGLGGLDGLGGLGGVGVGVRTCLII
jgi:hypothetical protein